MKIGDTVIFRDRKPRSLRSPYTQYNELECEILDILTRDNAPAAYWVGFFDGKEFAAQPEEVFPVQATTEAERIALRERGAVK